MPTKTTAEPKEFYVCIQSFAGNDFACAEGKRLRGDSALVQRFPDRFVADGTDDAVIASRQAVLNAPAPPREPLGRVKLRVLPGQGISTLDGGLPPQKVEQGGKAYFPGDVLEAEGADAQYLIDGGFCELVEGLKQKLGKAGKQIATGKMED